MASVFETPQFEAFVKYGALSLAKMLNMSLLTGVVRMAKGSFANKEDYKSSGRLSPDELKAKLATPDPFLERIRRCHLNDMENIPPFILTGLFFVLAANPTLDSCNWHFRIFLASRILHSICYILALPQPSRLLCFTVGFVTTCSMLLRAIAAVW
ncbi:putative microsomal glutathione S-transferase 1 [Apostichopus japonicus]|uniref:Microsomal glutathione S-transferase 1 n=1 Tax=Stichopus japonicus TaxID=307972 RepID=A0A2G8LDE4_STIJA|nr:putative microsomal glutathione S-transferase 1 [Apostichopus japonicus]